MVCLVLAGLAMIAIPMVDNKYVLFLPMVGIGIAWASMMGIPYIMVAKLSYCRKLCRP